MARRDGRNATHYWSDPHLPGVGLLRANLTTHHFAPHLHDAYVIAVTETGTASITCRGRTGDVHGDVIFVSNPQEPQAASVRPNDPWYYRAFYISEGAAGTLARGLGLAKFPYFAAPFCLAPAIAESMRTLHRALEMNEASGDGHEVSMQWIETMGALVAHYGGGGIPPVAERDATMVQRVITFMRERYADRLGLEELSSAAGVNPFQLITVFKRAVGMTPYTYLTQVRLEAARRSLLLGGSIPSAAVSAGFYDQSAFTRYFKRSYGITPLQFAAANRHSPLGVAI